MATVADLYRQFLGREPDAAGLSFWQEATKGGATPGVDPEEITAFLQSAGATGEQPRFGADVRTRNVIERGDEGMFSFSQAPAYTPKAREGDKTFEGQNYFEADRLNIFNQLKAQQAAGMKYTASFTKNETDILNDLSKRLAAQGVRDLTDLQPIMSGPTTRDTGEGQMERVESAQIGLYNKRTGEQLSNKMLTNSSGKGTTNYQAAFVNGVPVFTATKAATGLEQIQQDFGPILAIAASAILPGIPVGGTTLGNLVGTSLGLEGAAAKAVGSALVAGGGTYAATGSPEKAALAALMVGGGGYLKDTGVLGEAMDKVGLSDFKDTLGVTGGEPVSGIEGMAGIADEVYAGSDLGRGLLDVAPVAAPVGTVAAIPGAVSGAPAAATTALPAAASVAPAVAPVAAGGTPLGFEGIAQSSALAGGAAAGAPGAVGTAGFGTALPAASTVAADLVAAGVSPGTAANLAGGTAAGVGATGLLGGATAGAAGAAGGSILGDLGRGLLGALPDVLSTGITYATQQRQIDQLLGVGNAAAQRLTDLANKSVLSPAEYAEITRLAQEAQTGSAAAGQTAANALNAIADRAALSPETYSQLSSLANQVKRESAAAGRASQVPFTPYTMTTGFGRTTVSPSGATANAAPEYDRLRQQLLGLSGETLGAINPAQAAQTLYGQVEALAAPGREREQLALQQRLARQGLLGFGSTLPTTGGGTRTVNPLFESLLSAQESARAQQALQAQQFGTTEAQRQAALAQGFLGGAQGIDQQTLAQLQQTAATGINLNQLEQANRARALQATLSGITAPLTTGMASAQMQQTDLARQAALRQAGVGYQYSGTMAGLGVPLTTAQDLARLRQADLNRQAQLGLVGEGLRSEAALAALRPQQQQTAAAGTLAQGLLNPFATALTRGVTELFGRG